MSTVAGGGFHSLVSAVERGDKTDAKAAML